MSIEIMCLPGTMCDERLWQFTQAALGSKVRLNHLALPMEKSIDVIVEALAVDLPKQPFNLLGFSMGGYLACAFAIKYPQRIHRLMVVSNGAAGLLEKDVLQRQQALNWVAKQGYNGIPRKKAIAMLGARNKSSDALVDIIQQMDESLGQAVFVQQLSSSLQRPDILAELVGQSIPTCFVGGREDELVSVASLVDRIKMTELSELHLASHCGHMVPLEQPLWFAQVIQRFYEKS